MQNPQRDTFVCVTEEHCIYLI